MDALEFLKERKRLCEVYFLNFGPDDFCSYGEKKEE